MRNNADKHFASAKCKNGSQAGKQKDKTELLIGFHSVYEALKAQRRSFYRIFISKQRTGPQPAKITELAQEHKLTVENITSKALDQLTNNAKHQGFAALTSHFPVHTGNELIQKINKATPPNLISDLVSGLILVLENIEDPHNLGALIRTAICAGVDFILIPGNRAAGPSPTVSAISAGAMEHAQIGIMTNTASSLKALKDKGVLMLDIAIVCASEWLNRYLGVYAKSLGKSEVRQAQLASGVDFHLIEVILGPRSETHESSVANNSCLGPALANMKGKGGLTVTSRTLGSSGSSTGKAGGCPASWRRRSRTCRTTAATWRAFPHSRIC